MSPLPVYLLNAFIPQNPHGGNQAAVVVFPNSSDSRAKDEEYMLNVAKDFGFSETAFLVPHVINDSDATYGLRWFTPEVEVPLCGHATLASSSTLFTLYPNLQTLQFQTLSGQLTAKRSSDAVEISLPSLQPSILEAIANNINSTEFKGLTEGFVDASLGGLRKEDMVNVGEFAHGESFIIELKAEVPLGDLKFDVKKLLKLAKRMIIVTQQIPDESNAELRIDSRVFAPGLGIDEDPVTGSAHAYLTGYYLASPVAQRLPSQFRSNPKGTTIDARQVSPRGGAMKCKWDDGRVKLVGRAWEFARGNLAE